MEVGCSFHRAVLSALGVIEFVSKQPRRPNGRLQTFRYGQRIVGEPMEKGRASSHNIIS